MRSDLLERLMRIVARTGERHVLVDASLPEPLVVLPLGAYESLIGGKSPGNPAAAARPAPAAPAMVPEPEMPLNEEEKFYLEPID
jgi:hypothetical protein